MWIASPDWYEIWLVINIAIIWIKQPIINLPCCSTHPIKQNVTSQSPPSLDNPHPAILAASFAAVLLQQTNKLTSCWLRSLLHYPEDIQIIHQITCTSLFQQRTGNYQPHYLVGPLQNLMHSQISHVLLYSVFFQIPIPSMNLQRVVHHIRTQLSCNLLSHSRIDSFVGIVGVDQTGRFPDNQPKSYWLYLEVMRSDAISAYLNCRYWKSDSFLPNCLRLFIYFFEAYRQKAAPPKLQLAMFILPPSNAFMAILKPSPSLPIRLQAGILTLSKLTKAVGCIVHPIFYSFLP